MDTRLRTRVARLVLASVVGLLGLVMAAPAGAQSTDTVLATEARGPITQVTVDHLDDAIAEAAQVGAVALLVELDTPGGQVNTTRDLVQSLLLADVPVIVYVAPSGSRAGSAGVFMTYAAHVAAMAPGTTIGAATPIGPDGEEVIDKIMEDTVAWAQSIAEERGRDVEFAEEAVREGRSVTADVALEIGAVDVLAETREELLEAIDGEQIPLGPDETVTLSTAGASITEYEMSTARSILQALANPELAFIFISIGTLAVIYELANPGAGIGGVVGAIMLVLAFYSLSILPTNFAGLALLLLGIALLVAELFAPGVGVLAGGGALSLLFAGLLLFDRTEGITLSWGVLAPTVLLAGAGAVAIGIMAARERKRPVTIGKGALVGKEAEVKTVSDDRLQVFVDGALWDARTENGDLKQGERVRVVRQEGLQLFVEREET